MNWSKISASLIKHLPTALAAIFVAATIIVCEYCFLGQLAEQGFK